MKNKALKHYKRKKFFYRFFMRKSPRSGAMFGLAWMICFGTILPLVPAVFLNIVPEKLDSCVVKFVLQWGTGILFFAVCLLIYAYGFLTFAKNFYTILRNDLKKSSYWKLPVAIGAVFREVAGFLLFIIAIKKRRWAALIFLAGSFTCAIAGFFYFDSSLQKWLSIFFGQSLLLLCAIGGSGREKKSCRSFVLPVVLILTFLFLFYIANISIEYIMNKKLDALAVATGWHAGRDISARTLKKRFFWSRKLNYELAERFVGIGIKIDLDQYETPEEAGKILAELRKKYAEDFKIIDKILAIEPKNITYGFDDFSIMTLLLPKLNSFRVATQLRVLEMRAEAKDKTLVSKCNQDILKCREWCFHHETLIGQLVAAAIDCIRMDAVSYAMACGVYSKEEIYKLIGEMPDWKKQFADSLAWDSALAEEAVGFVEKKSGGNIMETGIAVNRRAYWIFCQKYAPLLIKLNLKRDHLYAVTHYLKIAELFYRDDLSGLEKKKYALPDKAFFNRNYFMLSSFVIPSFGGCLLRVDRITDRRQMALIAAGVMEYRKQNGKLPEDLSFLPQVPLAKLDHKPLMYEKTREGFRIFSHTDKGEKPDEKDTQYSYRVSLPEQAELPPEKLISIAEKELVKVYGKQVLKQRPWKISRSDEKSITLTGTFHGQGKGGVAEITLQKSNGKVLRMIHGK